jgi:hypothetical protein
MKIATPLQVGKSLANCTSVYKFIWFIAIITIKRANKDRLTPIQIPSNQASVEVVSTL